MDRETHLRQRESLLRISRALTAQLELDSVLTLVIDVAVELLAGTTGLIALREEGGQLQIRAATNMSPESWPIFDALLATPLDDRPRVQAALHQASLSADLPLRHMTALPLVFRHTSVGVIYVFRAAVNLEFTAEEGDLLSAFAQQAAIAVSNARLFQSVVREKQHLAALIEQSADGVMIIDARWRITSFNRAMEQLTGTERSAAIGRPCAEVVGITSQEGINLCLSDCPLQRRPLADEPVIAGWVSSGDGRRRYVQSRYAVQLGANGEFLGAIANVRDITLQRAEEALQNSFISVMSHELKTPVSIIKGYAEMLAREDAQWDLATIRDGLHVIIDEADRLTRQINALLEVSRLHADGMRLTLREWALPPLAHQVIERLAPHAGPQFSFELRFADDFPAVMGDEERTRTVLENLVTNAIKYSPDGGMIRVTGRVAGDDAVIAVSDQGIGIAAADQARIFGRFYRVDNRLRRETQGAGLGLFLCRGIVEAQGGTIWVESQPGRGSRFSFTMPLARRQLTTDAPLPARPASGVVRLLEDHASHGSDHV